MRVMKSVQQHYTPNSEVLWLLEQFRVMLNECIHIGLQENVTSLKSLSLKAYKALARYGIMSCYKLGAISAATGILRNHRKAKRKNPKTKEPYAKRLQLKTCYGSTENGNFKIENDAILLPIKPHHPIPIPLNQHTLEVLSGPNLEIRAVTLTEETLSITYMREVEPIQPHGLVALDRNLDNVTLADSSGQVIRHDLSEATRIKAQCRETKHHMKRNDAHVRRRVFGKYGRIQRNKVQQILHHASKQIVEQAKRNQHGIVMENIKNIRRLYRKGNWQGKKYRGTMNSWSFAELQRQIEYKARWEGLLVIYVPPYGTSSRCSICGSRMKPEENRTLRCPSCGYVVDRDVNAAKNILARGLRFSPVAPQIEAMVSVLTPPVDCGESSPMGK